MAFFAGFQSKSRTVLFATSIVLEEMKKIAAEEVSDRELETAKNSFIQTFPQAFATKGQIAGTFMDEEFTGRAKANAKYYDEFRAKIAAVDKAAVQAVAKKYLVPGKVVVLIVGDKDEILKGHPDHPVKLVDLSPGGLIELPLRDPFTLKPLE